MPLADALGANSTVTALRLGLNKISGAGAVALGAMLATNTSVLHLGLEWQGSRATTPSRRWT